MKSVKKPTVVDTEANDRFRDRARHYDWDPDDMFVGGYVDWEWAHGRHAFDNLFASVDQKHVLEFGCHFGGTAIVLAALGADVTALDVDMQYVELAQLNAERYGLHDRIHIAHVPDTTRLPYSTKQFDLVSCNSVLEYIPLQTLSAVTRELDRVLRPGGHIVIAGTSNRLWPRETHSGRWLVNYVPRSLHHIFPGKRIESISPFRIRSQFPTYEDISLQSQGNLIVELKRRMGFSDRRLALFSMANRFLTPIKMHVGMLLPSITMILQKPG